MMPRLQRFLVAAALSAITLAAYANSFRSGFVLDNAFLLLDDTRVHAATRANLALIIQHDYWWPFAESGLYRPLTTLSYLFNYTILGNTTHPAGYHWINLFLHTGNVLLVFALARRLVRNFWPSFLIASMWAVHPVLTESVTNIAGRADLLAGTATLGGLLVYLKAAESSARTRLGWLAALAAITAVGVFCKESAVALPAIIVLYELIWWDRRRLPGFGAACAAMAPGLLAMWWARTTVLGGPTRGVFPFVDNPIAGTSFWTGRLTALKVLAKYLGLLVWPSHLSADYSYAQIPLIDGGFTDWVTWIVIASLAAATACLFRRNKTAFFAVAFAFVTLLPASNLIVPVGTIMAERFLYLPAIGLAIIVTLGLYSLTSRITTRAPTALCGVIVVCFTFRTHVRNADWLDDVTLWESAVETSPLSFKTHTALAKTLLRANDPDSARIADEDAAGLAILDPLPDKLNEAPVYYSVGTQYVLVGDSLRRRYPDGRIVTPPDSLSEYEAARQAFLRSLSIKEGQIKAGLPPAPKEEIYAWLMISQTWQREGKTAEALRSARQAQQLGPMTPAVYLRIHDVLTLSGQKDEASAALLEGILLTSDSDLTRQVVEDYSASPDENKCVSAQTQGKPAIDFSCPAVRKQVCSISDEVNRLALKAGEPEVATRLKNELATKYACREGS